MQTCDFCGKKIGGLSRRCKYCGNTYCNEHRLPEDHNCVYLKKQKGKNQKKRANTTKGYLEEEYDDETYEHTEQKTISYKTSNIKKKNSPFKIFLKEYLPAIILILIILAIIAYSKGIIPPLIKFCEDGTQYNHCSKTKPLYCNQGELINNVNECGCPYGYEEKLELCKKIPTCPDGTFYSECGNKPMYCFNGTLIPKASICGCPKDTVQQGEICVNKYETNPKNVSLYRVGKFMVYEGLNDYLASLDRSILYYSVLPTTKDFILKNLDNEIQREYLLPLVDQIKIKSAIPKEQAKIAIRMVQEIPYDTLAATTNSITARYAYEVLYDMKGVCMEKSDLMAFLLRELGFGVAIFEFDAENHRAVGIRCSKGNYNSDYCFIESTEVYSVGKIPSNYVGGVDIRRATPEVVVISEGYLFE